MWCAHSLTTVTYPDASVAPKGREVDLQSRRPPAFVLKQEGEVVSGGQVRRMVRRVDCRSVRHVAQGVLAHAGGRLPCPKNTTRKIRRSKFCSVDCSKKRYQLYAYQRTLADALLGRYRPATLFSSDIICSAVPELDAGDSGQVTVGLMLHLAFPPIVVEWQEPMYQNLQMNYYDAVQSRRCDQPFLEQRRRLCVCKDPLVV